MCVFMCTRDFRCNDVACKCESLSFCCACHKLEEDGRVPGLTGCIAMLSCVGHGGTSTSPSYFALCVSEGRAKLQVHSRSLCLLAAMPGQPTLRATSRSHARTDTKQSLAWVCVTSMSSLHEACETGVRSSPWRGCGSDPDVCGGAASRTCSSHFESTWYVQAGRGRRPHQAQ